MRVIPLNLTYAVLKTHCFPHFAQIFVNVTVSHWPSEQDLTNMIMEYLEKGKYKWNSKTVRVEHSTGDLRERKLCES